MCRFSDAGNDEAGHTRGYGDLAQGSAPVGRHSDIILCAYETFELESSKAIPQPHRSSTPLQAQNIRQP